MRTSQMISDLISTMTIVNTVVQFAIFVVIFVAALRIYSGKYGKMLLTILEPLGFDIRSVSDLIYFFRVLTLCRFTKNNTAVNNVRVFCEHMILRSQGENKDKKWWHYEFNTFKSLIENKQSDVFKMKNLLEISSDELEKATSNYFKFLHNNRKKYSIEEKQCNSFLTRVEINRGLLTTNFLISGLLKTYKDDWNLLIEKYTETVNDELSAKNVDDWYTAEVSYAFVWLLWGPSYQLVEEQTGDYKIAQYSFGDENNSVVIIVPETRNNKENMDLWDKIKKTPNGVVCGLTCKLCSATEYMENKREHFGLHSTYYINKIKSENGFILEKDDVNNIKEQGEPQAINYYCTSYVWILFYSTDNVESDFEAKNIISFFEHANQADKGSYDLCVELLIVKTFAFFDKALKENTQKRRYHYLFSMNQDINEKFQKMYAIKKSASNDMSKYYSEFLIVRDYAYTRPERIFPQLDKYISAACGKLIIKEVKYNDKKLLAYWGQYYTGIHIHESQNKKKAVSLDNMIEYLRTSWEEKMPPLYYVVLNDNDNNNDKVIAGIILEYDSKTNCLSLDSLHIKKDHQSNIAEIRKQAKRQLMQHLLPDDYGFNEDSFTSL